MLAKSGWPRDWGFKLPESILILPELRKAFPSANYIYLERDLSTTVFRRSHMTARLDNEIGRACLRAAYDYIGRERVNILTDSEVMRMAATTRHQVDMADRFSAEVQDHWRTLSFEESIRDPLSTLSQLSNILRLPVQGDKTLRSVDRNRSSSKQHRFSDAEVEAAMNILNQPL
jgi:hypothetical protein